MVQDLLAALSLVIIAPRIDATVIRERQAVVWAGLNILNLYLEILKLLDQKGRCREVQMLVVQTELSKLIVTNREQFTLFRQKQRVRKSTTNFLDQNVEAQAFGDADIPIFVMILWILTVAQLSKTVKSLWKVLSVAILRFLDF